MANCGWRMYGISSRSRLEDGDAVYLVGNNNQAMRVYSIDCTYPIDR